jgi:hypothetical protein
VKISEGIREGSKGRHQIKGSWYDNGNGVCAIGALMKLPGYSGGIIDDFPALSSPYKGSTYYEPVPREQPLINFIIEMNEKGESFDAIIKWLESIGQ